MINQLYKFFKSSHYYSKNNTFFLILIQQQTWLISKQQTKLKSDYTLIIPEITDAWNLKINLKRFVLTTDARKKDTR